MKNSKSNNKISVATIFFEASWLRYQPTFIAYLNSFSASRYNHNGHRESTYVMVNRRSRWGGGAGYPCSGPMPVWHAHDE